MIVQNNCCLGLINDRRVRFLIIEKVSPLDQGIFEYQNFLLRVGLSAQTFFTYGSSQREMIHHGTRSTSAGQVKQELQEPGKLWALFRTRARLLVASNQH